MKNLELEYKNMINQEVPDLWARIESALPEKHLTNNATKAVASDITSNTVTNNDIKPSNETVNSNVVNISDALDADTQSRRKWSKIRKTLTTLSIVAACVVGVASITVLSRFAKDNTASFTSAPMMEDCATTAEEAYDTSDDHGGSGAMGITSIFGGKSESASESADTNDSYEAADSAYDYEDSDGCADYESAELVDDELDIETETDSVGGVGMSQDFAAITNGDNTDSTVSENSVSENSVSENAIDDDETDSTGKEGRK